MLRRAMSGRLVRCAASLRTVTSIPRITSRPLRSSSLFFPVVASRVVSARHVSTDAVPVADAPETFEAEAEDDADADADAEASVAASSKEETQRLMRLVKRELKHIVDPYQIGKHVEILLAKDDVEHALLLTQAASKDKQVVVSWNHIIAYFFERDQFRRAITSYNQMKKRGQLPNVQTYTSIFRGCAKSSHSKLAVTEAFKHYNILLQDRRLEPNSIHLNALLNVCARAGDIDAMFLIAKSINDTTRAANSTTYTTILNGLRYHITNSQRILGNELRMEMVTSTVDRAKRIWVEVMSKWESGRLQIDEKLVCAMGRLLLSGPPKLTPRSDIFEIFDLVHQTMNIPNYAAVAANRTSDAEPSTNAAKHSGLFAKPGRNTLALILTAASRINSGSRVSSKYWNHVVNEHGVQPDEDIWTRFLNTLRRAKSSAEAASVLSQIEKPSPLAYRIAMETCIRDNINPNAMANANKILDTMLSARELPDVQTLRLYLRVALVSHYHQRAKARDGDEEAAKHEYGTQILEALKKLWEPYRKAYSRAFNGAKGAKLPGERYNDQREVIALARQMYSTSNKVIFEEMLPPKDVRVLKQFGGIVNREVQQFFADREDMEPRLRDYPGKKDSRDRDRRIVQDSSLRQGGDFVWDTAKDAKERAKA